jgi:hypothetical protein
VTGAGAAPVAPPRPRPAHPRVPARNLSRVAAELPLHPVLFPVRSRGGHPPRCAQGHLAGDAPSGSLPSVSSWWLRPRSLTP